MSREENGLLAGRYALGRRLGSGSMGDVFLAQDFAADRNVAIKRIRSVHEAARERFVREARAMSVLRHPNIVEILGSETTARGDAFIVMEYLEGEDLAATLLREGRLEWRQARVLALQILSALQCAHRAGIVHRDLKPTNCFIVGRGDRPTLKILDFGIARFMEEDSEMSMLTQTGVLIGTPAYMSPEQAAGQRVDSRSDLYSAAVLLFKMVTGELPFAASDPLSMLLKHVSEEPPLPSSCGDASGLPAALDHVLLRGLAKDPERRIQTAKLFAEALAAIDDDFGGDTLHVDRAATRLYGRDTERRAIVEALSQEPRRARVILVCGAAGAGKTALVRIALDSREIKAKVLAGKAEFGQTSPLSTLLQMLGQLLERRLAASEDRDALAAKLRADVGAGLTLLCAALPRLAALVGGSEPALALPFAQGERRLIEAVRRLVAVLADGPQILWVDDLQWADVATVRILASLLLEPPACGVVVVATTRPGAETERLLVEALEGPDYDGAWTTRVNLGPIEVEAVTELVADTLAISVHKVAELARIVHELTNGFPLFVRELLDHLMTEGALNFNPGRGRWVWDVEAIRRAELPLSLTSLLGQRLARLSPECTSVLRVAALLGAQVSSREVADVLECTNEEILRSVMEAMSRKVIQLVEGGAPSGEGGDVKYAFVHDSVRRAIVTEAGHAKEAALHAKIGRRLLCLGRQRAAVYHLNRAPTPAQRVEVVQLVRLNLEAGREAKEMVALDIAYEFLSGGGRLIDAPLWEDERALAFEVLLNTGEVHYLSGNLDESETVLNELALRSRSTREILEVASRRVALELIRGRHVEALDVGCAALARVGRELPVGRADCATVASVLLDRIRRLLDERGVDKLAATPRGGSYEDILCLQLLSELMSAAHMGRPRLFAVIAAQLTLLSQLTGQIDASPHGYACLAFYVVNQRGPDDLGRSLAELALKSATALGPSRYTGRVRFVVGSIAFAFWPLSHAKEHLAEAMRIGVEVGDHVYASYAASHLVMLTFGEGQELSALHKVVGECVALTRRTRVASSLATTTIAERFARLLAGADGEELASADMIAELEADGLAFPLAWYYVATLILSYFNGESAAAHVAIEQAEMHLAGSSWYAQALLDLFACLASAREASMPRRAEIYSRSARRLRAFARMNPEYFNAMCNIVELAWRTTTEGDSLTDVNLADEIMVEGERRGAMYAALFGEVVGDYHRRYGRTSSARGCFEASLRAYREWGAGGLIDHVLARLGWRRDVSPPDVDPLDRTGFAGAREAGKVTGT